MNTVKNISEFVERVIYQSEKSNNFPKRQILEYCKKLQVTSLERLSNVFQGFYISFSQSYINFKEIVVILCIGLEIEVKKCKKVDQELKSTALLDQKTFVSKSIHFLSDLISSKMILVCSRKLKDTKHISQREALFNKQTGLNFQFVKALVSSLVPKILRTKQNLLIVKMLQQTNKANVPNVGINFLVESILINKVLDCSNLKSSQQFKKSLRKILSSEKFGVLSRRWNLESGLQQGLEVDQFVYLRKNPESDVLMNIRVEEKTVKLQRSKKVVDRWIHEAYLQHPSRHQLERAPKGSSILQMYQFLFKLEVFASSPKIECLDDLLPNEDFLMFFSSFLLGESLSQSSESSSNMEKVVDSLQLIQGIFDNLKAPYRHLVCHQLGKMSEGQSKTVQNQTKK